MQQYAPAPGQYYPFPGVQPAAYYAPEGAYPPPPAWGHVPGHVPSQNIPVPLHSPTNGVYPGYGGPALHSVAQPPLQRPKHSSRISTQHREARDTRTAVPLRSAMKKRPGSAASNTRPATPRPPTPRSRSTSSTRSSTRVPVNQMTRQRTNSMSKSVWEPVHLLMSFHGNNEICFEGVRYQNMLDDLRELVFPMWPHGVDTDSAKDHRWRVVFGRAPWSSTGTEKLMVRRMLCRMFSFLARLGYHYSTSVNIGSRGKPPRLVFVDRGESARDPHVHFFSVCFSRSDEKVSIVDPPGTIRDSIGTALRNAFPRRIASDRVTEENICLIELKRGVIGAADVDKSLFVSYVLKHINELGYKLDACVPLARRGPLGFGGRKEIWIFKGTLD